MPNKKRNPLERLLKSRSGQGISLNTIIIAAIGLAVLVVLFIMLTSRFEIFSQGVKGSSLTCQRGCKAVGYDSFGISGNTCNLGETQISGSYEDIKEGEVCCCS